MTSINLNEKAIQYRRTPGFSKLEEKFVLAGLKFGWFSDSKYLSFNQFQGVSTTFSKLNPQEYQEKTETQVLKIEPFVIEDDEEEIEEEEKQLDKVVKQFSDIVKINNNVNENDDELPVVPLIRTQKKTIDRLLDSEDENENESPFDRNVHSDSEDDVIVLTGEREKFKDSSFLDVKNEDEEDEDDKENIFDLTNVSFRTPSKPKNRTIDPSTSKKIFIQNRTLLSMQLYNEYNINVFDGKLPNTMNIIWSPHLTTTAGRARLTQASNKRTAEIDLSIKVVDCEERLRQTLAHELCHVAAWIIDGVSKPPHGAAFKSWASYFHDKYPDLNIKTCHNYEIDYKYKYQCTKCSTIYGRHSRSINTNEQGCQCGGRLFLNKKGKERKEIYVD